MVRSKAVVAGIVGILEKDFIGDMSTFQEADSVLVTLPAPEAPSLDRSCMAEGQFLMHTHSSFVIWSTSAM